MARSKSIDNMSAEELYELARQREQQESSKADETREQIAALKQQRKELVSAHNKALKAVDREIAKLQGGKGSRGKRSGNRAPRGQLAERALALVAKKGPIKGRDLKALLEKEGLDATYIAQTLATLKKKGQVTSPERGVYQAA